MILEPRTTQHRTRDCARPGRWSSFPGCIATIVAALAVSTSLMPSLLPRSSVIQALFTGLLVVTGTVVSAFLERMSQNRSPAGRVGPPSGEHRVLAAIADVSLVAVSATVSHRWQNALRAAMDVPPIGVRHWVEVLAGAVAVVLVFTGAARLFRELVRRAGKRQLVAVAVAAAALAAACTTSAALPSSGSSHGVTDRIGESGRRFLSVESDGVSVPVRVYAGLSAAATVSERADVAVRELDRAGGFDRDHLVVAVPTGSGWIDANAVRGFEARWGDDVAIVAQQYADTPSWVTFLLDRDAAAESAQAMVGAIRTHLESLPDRHRPQVHVYGQSLGAVGGSAVFDEDRVEPCDALWVGPPAGGRYADGATVLANTSDPVVWWQPSLLWSPPDLDRARRDAPVPSWIPVVSFLQTTVDLLVSLDAAPGHGHRYGTDQTDCPEG